MKRDFTYYKYEQFLRAILDTGYTCVSVEDYFSRLPDLPQKVFILRHDIDRLPFNAVEFARIQHRHNVRGTYYWRVVPESYNADAIREVVSLGHELGYHYEDLTLCKGDFDAALSHFGKQLEMFRTFYPVKTACMHGSPMTRWDNRSIWEKASYSDFGIIAEPYYDFDFGTIFYLTDTGRQWNNSRISVRDKVDSGYHIPVNGTDDIIRKLRNGELPDRVMYNIHPQRWNNDTYRWTKELVLQNIKNVVKRSIVSRKAINP